MRKISTWKTYRGTQRHKHSGRSGPCQITVMDAGLEDNLGYTKQDYKDKNGTNSRNGIVAKTNTSSQGPSELHVLRDREGNHDPQILKKPQLDVSAIEHKLMFLYSQGTSKIHALGHYYHLQ